MTDCRPFVLKTVNTRFNSADLSFDLSHALFSSNDIDAGSRLLLKNIARYVPKDAVRTVLDIGSGTGVLGIACAKAYNAESALLRDRDALATAFSAHNARRNKCRNVQTETALLLDGLSGRHFDLVLCNVPAKAGPPVLDWFISHLDAVVSATGTAGIVVVNTIAPAARQSLARAEVAMKAVDEGKGHTVFLFGPKSERVLPGDCGALRLSGRTDRQNMELAGRRYAFCGYYGLPEFDSCSYATQLAAEVADLVLDGTSVKRSLVLEPGVGHLACYLRSRSKTQIDLCSRDALALAACRANLIMAAKDPAMAAAGLDFHFLEDIETSDYDLFLALPETIPGVDQTIQFWEAAARILLPGAVMVVALASTFFDRLEKKKPRGFVKLREKKRKGYVAAAWRYEGAEHESQ